MNKKIPIGSIIAVVILVLVSFIGVVGYQTTTSTIAKASPLFSVRSTRAIDKKSKDIACDYVGKGKPTLVTIPKRSDKLEIVQKVLDIISKTDDKIFNVYLNMLINQIQKNDKYDDVNINEMINAIHQLRNNPDRTCLNVYKNGNYTWRYEWHMTYCWLPGCIIISAIRGILQIINFIRIFTHVPMCYSLAYHGYTLYCPKSDF